MEIAFEKNYLFDQGKIYSLMGEIENLEDGNAEDHFSKSLDIFSSIGRKYEQAVAMEQLGRVKISKGQKKMGEKYVNDAKIILSELGVRDY